METAPDSSRGLVRSAGIVGAAVFLSRITGVVREVVMARLFGAGQVYDAFLLGTRIPMLARNLFAEGALSAAFVPVFTHYLAKGKREAAELSNVVATALVFAVGAACAVGIVFSPTLVRIMAPGFEQVPGKFELAVLLTRIMFPFLVLVSLAAQMMGLLNACGRFGVPALASMFFNLGSVAFGLLFAVALHDMFGYELIVSMALGVLAGGVLQIAWQAPSLYGAGFGWRPRIDPRHPGLRQILRLMLPAVLGNAALHINALVNTNLASAFTDSAGNVMNGPVSWLGYAFRFLQLPLGVFGVAVASASLPSLSRDAAAGRTSTFCRTVEQSLGMVLLLTIPSSVALAVLGESMIGTIYQWGRFEAADTRQTALALTGYSVGLAGYAAAKILAQAFYALNNSRIPALISIASIMVNLAVALGLVNWTELGHAGLALSTSVVATFGAVLLFATLSRLTSGLDGKRLAWSTLKILAASAIMGVGCRASSIAVYHWTGGGKTAQLADVGISIPFGALIFYTTARRFGLQEVEALRIACYTALLRRNATRPDVGDPSSGNR